MRRLLASCLLIEAVCAGTSLAREYQVRLLQGDENNGTWGTSEFEVQVNYMGSVRSVKVKGVEVLRQSAALYTSPIDPGTKSGARTVQGEGFGARGLSVERPTMKTWDDDGTRFFEFHIVVSSRKVLSGAALCDVRERVVIRPTGEIDVRYDFEWLETLTWQMFSLLTLMNDEACRDREFMILMGDRVTSGNLEKGPVEQRRIRGEVFDQLTVRPEVGPFHIVWREKAKCSFHWSGGVQLHIAPPAVPYRKPIFKGQKDRIDYRILLPVSQQ